MVAVLSMLRYLITFLPWIAFAVLNHGGHDNRMGAITGLILAVALLFEARARRHRPWDTLIIEASSAVFFLILGLLALFVRHAPFGVYGTAVSSAWLAAVVFGTLAIRRPFTLGIARTTASAQAQASPIFYRTNAVISAVWGAAFTAETFALVALDVLAPHATAAVIAVHVTGFSVAAVFTVRYSKEVAAKARAQAMAQAQTQAMAQAQASAQYGYGQPTAPAEQPTQPIQYGRPNQWSR